MEIASFVCVCLFVCLFVVFAVIWLIEFSLLCAFAVHPLASSLPAPSSPDDCSLLKFCFPFFQFYVSFCLRKNGSFACCSCRVCVDGIFFLAHLVSRRVGGESVECWGETAKCRIEDERSVEEPKTSF